MKYVGEVIALLFALTIAGLHLWAIETAVGWNKWTHILFGLDALAVLICLFVIYAAVRRERERIRRRAVSVLSGERDIE